MGLFEILRRLLKAFYDPTDRTVFVSSASQMVKITQILKYRLEIGPKVGFSVANFLIPDFPIFFVKSPK